MNFFAHAVVAISRSEEPRFVLGAMLPDLASMAGLRLVAQDDAQLANGVALHHETDHRFHTAPAFVALCTSALSELEAQGVRRGAARAVGHVGSELLLDGALSGNDHARAIYLRALSAAIEQSLEIRVRSSFEGEHREPMRDLLVRLAAAPLPQGYRDVDFVYERMQRILARRPLLALAPQDRAPVLRWLRAAATRVHEDAGELVRDSS